jgi:hypothetical protein
LRLIHIGLACVSGNEHLAMIAISINRWESSSDHLKSDDDRSTQRLMSQSNEVT